MHDWYNNHWIIEKNLVEVIKREPLSYSCRRQPIASLKEACITVNLHRFRLYK